MLFVEHYVEDLLVGLAHALAGELADRFDGLFNVVFEYSVAAVQRFAFFRKDRSPEALPQRRRRSSLHKDGLAPSQTVPDIMPRVFVIVAETASYVPSKKPGNAGCRAAACRHRAAEGAEPADRRFLMYGYEI